MTFKDPDEQREYQRLWRAKRRAEWFADKSCVKCRSVERLELDHIDRATKVSHSIWSWSQEKREAEISKCQVLCHDCHLGKTVYENTKPLEHGTINGYNVKKCKCSDCRSCSAWRKRVQRYRAKHPEIVLRITGFIQ